MKTVRHPGRAVLLLSGGIDSATALAMAHAEGKELYALSFDYGQRHLRELASSKKLAAHFSVAEHRTIDFNLRDIGGSALTSDIAVPKSGVRSLGSGVSAQERISTPQPPIPVTYVPARNTIFLSFALAWAEVIGAEQIWIGANAVDYSGYPDCRPEYLQAFERMANLATRASVEGRLSFSIHAPLLMMSKAEIIKSGLGLGLDYAMTWSCYDPQPREAQQPGGGNQHTKKSSARMHRYTAFVPCGLCDSCRLREKGFREAGIQDPLSL